MGNLRKLEDLQANKAQQDQTDAKYRILVTQLDKHTEVLAFLKNSYSISQQDTILDEIQALIDELCKAVDSGLADKDDVKATDGKFTSLQSDSKKNWQKQYSDLTSATVSTLKVISGIESEKVNDCLDKIKKADTWTLDLNTYQNLLKSLESANELINGLGLDPDIVTFLQSMNSGKATLKDLSDKVLNWIKEEDLSGRIKLSFSMGLRK
jgi:LPS O-antigen subunit length determinant protein (WzzB/FepE family)